MKDFLQQNYLSIASIIIILGIVVYLVTKKKWSTLRELAYDFIKKAEKIFQGSKRGQEKFEAVFTEVYNLIPAWIRLFIPQNYLRKKLQEWYDLIKDELDDGKLNKST